MEVVHADRGGPVIQACLNGSGTTRVPITPDEIAQAALAACGSGAAELHIHPKAADGTDSMDPDIVAEVLSRVRAAVPGVPVGVTTGAWIDADPVRRSAFVRDWPVTPDYASVNWHEPGAELVARALLDRGIGVEAGLYTDQDGVQPMLFSGLTPQMLRLLVEVTDPRSPEAVLPARDMLAQVLNLGRPILMHGEQAAAWPMLTMALMMGHDSRIGLEDTLLLADGSTAADNAELVGAAAFLEMFIHAAAPEMDFRATNSGAKVQSWRGEGQRGD